MDAASPEELDTLFEDAFLLRDRQALLRLFERKAVLAILEPRRAAFGREQIDALIASLWVDGTSYVAEPRRVVLAGNTALVLGDQGISVARRNASGGWLYAISCLTNDDQEI